jgi:hypothetical protein
MPVLPLTRLKKHTPADLEEISSWAGIILFGGLAIALLIVAVVLAFYAW